MRTTKYKDFIVSSSGWIAAVMILLLAYPAYYGWLYPELARKVPPIEFRLEKKSLDKLTTDFSGEDTTEGVERIHVRITSPKYLTNFDDSEIIVEVENGTHHEANGCLYLSGSLRNDVTLDREALFPISPQRTLGIKLSPSETATFPVTVHINDPDAARLELSLSYIPGMKYDENSDKLCQATTDTQSVDEDQELKWAQAEGSCSLSSSETLAYACIPIDAGAGFIESAIRHLLLPPWGNRILPFVVFAMVWLSEDIIESARTDQRSKSTLTGRQWQWYVISVAVSLLEFPVSLLWLCTRGLQWLKMKIDKNNKWDLSPLRRAHGVFEIWPVALLLVVLVYCFAYGILTSDFPLILQADASYKSILKVILISLTPLLAILVIQWHAMLWVPMAFPLSDMESTSDEPCQEALRYRMYNLQTKIDDILGAIELGAYENAYQQAEKLPNDGPLPDYTGDLEDVLQPFAYYDASCKEWRLRPGMTILQVITKKIIKAINSGASPSRISEALIKKLPPDLQNDFMNNPKVDIK